MVEELLDFSRMQNGKFTMEKNRMDILAELEDAILIYGEKAKRDNITLNYNAPEMLPLINGDKNRLRQVFINIIDNAIKYSNPGCTVNVEASEVEGGVQIVVEDNGCGIKESDLPRIKTKFFKANHTRRGSGIGLAVADEIVTMHGGTLEVQSQENVGTTVIITLPIEVSQ
jgi:signal transduction histidine kinase